MKCSPSLRASFAACRWTKLTKLALAGLAVIVLGGLGDIPGAVIGGLLIGLAEAFVPAEYVAYKDAVAFALLFIVLLIRPQGLLGRAQIQKV